MPGPALIALFLLRAGVDAQALNLPGLPPDAMLAPGEGRSLMIRKDLGFQAPWKSGAGGGI